jgi:hypothetical protein
LIVVAVLALSAPGAQQHGRAEDRTQEAAAYNGLEAVALQPLAQQVRRVHPQNS